jgi:hypothetical protein
MTQGITSPDYVGIGFDKIDRDLKFLSECLGEVLSELGHDEHPSRDIARTSTASDHRSRYV